MTFFDGYKNEIVRRDMPLPPTTGTWLKHESKYWCVDYTIIITTLCEVVAEVTVSPASAARRGG